MKKIAILGITGSIGKSALEVIREHSKDFKIVLASAHHNLEKLQKIGKEFQIKKLVFTNEIKPKIKSRYLYFGEDELLKILASIDCDIVLNAISGSAGLRYSVVTLENGIDLALANKESLVMAGEIIMEKVKNSQNRLLPVDSEHSAISQALLGSAISEVKKIILTASGGPFRTLPLKNFEKITLTDTLQHPTWKMGAKITIDSATMMNKALEVIEAHWLFGKSYDEIEAVIHPQSIVHSFLEYVDGSILAQMSLPTMKIPILFALTYPKHIKSEIFKTEICKLPALTFSQVEKARYPLFFFTREIARNKGILPTILNAANEAAVSLFLDKKISFLQISKIVQRAVERESNQQNPTLEDILETNQTIYKKTLRDYFKLI